MHARTHARTHTRTYACMYIHVVTRTHICTRARMHVRKHARVLRIFHVLGIRVDAQMQIRKRPDLTTEVNLFHDFKKNIRMFITKPTAHITSHRLVAQLREFVFSQISAHIW